MKIRERIAEWENQRNQQQQVISGLSEKMDRLMTTLQDHPHLSRLQTEMTEMREALATAQTALDTANQEIATLKQTLPSPGSGDGTNQTAPANGAPDVVPKARQSRGSRARATFF